MGSDPRRSKVNNGPPSLPEDLVLAAQRGNTIAMNELLDHLTPIVARVCGPIALEHGPDAMQEAMIAIFRGLRSVREPAALDGWAIRIATREAIRVARSASKLITWESFPDLPAPWSDELSVDIEDVLARMPPEHRAILVLRDLEGYPEREAAAILAVPEGTAKSRLHRARTLFRRAWS